MTPVCAEGNTDNGILDGTTTQTPFPTGGQGVLSIGPGRLLYGGLRWPVPQGRVSTATVMPRTVCDYSIVPDWR